MFVKLSIDFVSFKGIRKLFVIGFENFKELFNGLVVGRIR